MRHIGYTRKLIAAVFALFTVLSVAACDQGQQGGGGGGGGDRTAPATPSG